MKGLKTLIILSALLMSCSESVGTFENDTELVSISENIAKNNDCKLNIEVERKGSTALNIKIESNPNDANLPGKVFWEYYTEMKKRKLSVDKMVVFRFQNELFSADEAKAKRIDALVENAHSLIINDEISIEKVYSNLHDSIRATIDYEAVTNNIKESKLDLSHPSFIGFEIVDHVIAVRFSNTINIFEVIYKLESDEMDIMGFNVE